MTQPVLSPPIRTAIEIAVYLLLIFAIVAWCLQILMPFVSFVTWGIIVAVALYPAFLKLRHSVGERNRLASTLFALLGLSIVILPAWLFAGSLLDSAASLRDSLQHGNFDIPSPNESVKSWPVVGERLYANWMAAEQNLEGWLQAHNQQVKQVAEGVLRVLSGIGLSVLQFIAAVLIATVLLANAKATKAMMLRLCRRLAGEKGDEFLTLSAATIRSVAVGVLGIAVIQALLGGLGMLAVGVPAAGLWALLILVLAIAQLPPLLVLLPAIIYVFSAGDNTLVAIVFAVWSVLVSFSDAFLKPLLLGRGVEAPMLVILLGAIGGMLHSGIVGLFLGAVILALGYRLFLAWMDAGPEGWVEPSPDADKGA